MFDLVKNIYITIDNVSISKKSSYTEDILVSLKIFFF